jgi:CRISPR/Cas system-associated endonuclease Cas1
VEPGLQCCQGHAIKSQAQRRKFAELLVEGKISNETFEEWNRETGRKKLPERAGRKKPARKASPKRRRKAR